MNSWAAYVTQRNPSRSVARIRPNPRIDAWHALCPGADPKSYPAWLEAQWKAYEAAHQLPPGAASTWQHQEPFDDWLTRGAGVETQRGMGR
ncbi:MAG: hypothetical protein AB7F35_20325 [Acetobacteraceae bacterium]